MRKFVEQHDSKIVGTLSCFDRVIWKGHTGLGYPKAMEGFLDREGMLYKDFKTYASGLADQIKEAAVATAERAGRVYEYLNSHENKEQKARGIAEEEGITEGLICVLSCLEMAPSFRLIYGKGKPRLKSTPRRCQHFYFYYLDRELGFMHVRLQSWFPFQIQVYVNGHNWLACKLDRHGIDHHRIDNAFTWLEQPERVQKFADRFPDKNWPRVLSAFARKVNPLLGKLLPNDVYYWVTDQSEYATDVLFKDRKALEALYEKLLAHTTLCFGAEDVLTFLGKKGLHPNFQGEVLNDQKKRLPGARVKHRVKENWIKMYDKFGCVLRIETVINCPYSFRVRRRGKRNGEWTVDWFPLLKGVGYLYRYAQICRQANHRYLDALAAVEDPARAYSQLHRVSKRVKRQGRSQRGFNPTAEEDVKVFKAVHRGEHCIRGFKNADVRQHLYPRAAADPKVRRRYTARVTRLLQRLRGHGLIGKVPNQRRYRITALGHAIMSAAILLHDHGILPALQST